MIEGMNHFTITAEEREATLGFYVGLLGLREGHRPDLGFPGAWLYAGGPQAVPRALALRVWTDRSTSDARRVVTLVGCRDE